MSISYETAKALRDAGFPQLLNSNLDLGSDSRVHEKTVYYPNLEELIEACGNIEFVIHCYPAMDDLNPKPWFVIERPKLMDMERQDTPSEAVANLYIAVHKK